MSWLGRRVSRPRVGEPRALFFVGGLYLGRTRTILVFYE